MRDAPALLWDQYGMFDVAETPFTTAINTLIQIAKSDASRVAIGFCWNGTDTQVSTLQSLTATSGIALRATYPFIQILQREWGALCNKDWFALPSAAGHLTVIETFLHRPDPGSSYEQNVNRTKELRDRLSRRTDSLKQQGAASYPGIGA